MVYNYRVTLSGLKGFFRLYEVNAKNTLYEFHKQMRSDMEFPQDQQILFKAFDADGNVMARYALIDLGYGSVDHITIEQVVKAGVASFVYFYDTIAKKSIIITFEGEAEGSHAINPTLVDVKGPNPIEFENGYVAFEDIPKEERMPRPKSILDLLAGSDDDDEDDEEEDEDDEDKDSEEEDIIYDENE